MSLSEIVAFAFAYPAAWGAGVAYSMYGARPLPLVVGAALALPATTALTSVNMSIPLPYPLNGALLETVAGGLIGYHLYGGDLMYTAAGAGIGIVVHHAVAGVVKSAM